MLRRAFVALGSNVGDRRHWLQFGAGELRRLSAGCRASPVYECRAHPLAAGHEKPDFLNAVVEIFTELSPGTLLRSCLSLEGQAGRVRTRRNAPRTLDLDILDMDGIVSRAAQLTLPHPRLALRRFVLQPWYDLAPEYYIGGRYRATVAQLLRDCPDAGSLVTCPWTLECEAH